MRRLAANGSEKEWLSPDLIGNGMDLRRNALELHGLASNSNGDE
nr:MAG TPA: hypothetical protein [Caudoviricetes sp.]